MVTIFEVGSKLTRGGKYNFQRVCTYSSLRNTSFKLLTITISPQAFSLWY